MSNLRQLNQSGAFWDFFAGLEETDFNNHPLVRAFMGNNNNNNSNTNDNNNNAATPTEPAQAAAGPSNTTERNMSGEPEAEVNNTSADEWDPFAAGVPFGPRGDRGGRGRAGFGARGGFGGCGRGGFDFMGSPPGAHGFPGHHGPQDRAWPPRGPPPFPDNDTPMPPPPPENDMAGPPAPDSDHERAHPHHGANRPEHCRGRGGFGARGGFGGRGGCAPRGRWGGPWGGQAINLDSLAEVFQSQIFGGGEKGKTHNSNNRNMTTDSTGTTAPNGDFTPPADIFDTENAFIVDVSIPGAKKSDVNVAWDAEKSELSITGIVHRSGDEEFLKTLALDERKVGAFARKVKLGSRANPAKVDADGIMAKLEEGVLRVTVPKEEKEFEVVKRVEII